VRIYERGAQNRGIIASERCNKTQSNIAGWSRRVVYVRTPGVNEGRVLCTRCSQQHAISN